MPGVFPFWQIALDAAVAFLASFVHLRSPGGAVSSGVGAQENECKRRETLVR